MYKKFNCIIIGISVLLLIFVGFINYLIDPYFHYHIPYFGMQAVVYDERYQNPGIAEHFHYNSILVGSSMTENFSVNELNASFNCNTVKLTYAAIRTGNMNYMFQKAFSTREIKNVFLGLDPDPLLDTPGNYYFPLPEYLYDNNSWNDLNYLLNKSVLFGSSVELVKRNIENSVPDIDSAYRWDGWSTFSKTEALSSVTWDIFTRSEEVVHPEYIENMYENIGKNIIPYIKENPNTNFYIFFPPYSLLWWNLRMNVGDLESILSLIKLCSEQLLQYDNVKLYGFQNVMPLVSELDNYKDYNHYKGEINTQIIEWMKNDQFLIRKNEIDTYINNLRNLVTTFDYSQFKVE